MSAGFSGKGIDTFTFTTGNSLASARRCSGVMVAPSVLFKRSRMPYKRRNRTFKQLTPFKLRTFVITHSGEFVAKCLTRGQKKSPEGITPPGIE